MQQPDEDAVRRSLERDGFAEPILLDPGGDPITPSPRRHSGPQTRENTNAMAPSPSTPASAAGTLTLGGDLTVNRMGFGAMRIVGKGVWGPPADRENAKSVLRHAVANGVNFIDT